jgi:hypothetical protein
LTAPCDKNNVEKLRCDEKMVGNFLEWLNETKKVTKVVKLKLPDSEHQYGTSFIDEQILRRFEIDELDWQVVDIEKDFMEKIGASKAKPMLKKVHLYSSGDKSLMPRLMEVVHVIRRCPVFQEVRTPSFGSHPF